MSWNKKKHAQANIISKAIICSAMCILFLSCCFLTAGAHGILIESKPKDGSTHYDSPEFLYMRFNTKLESSITQLILIDLNKKRQRLKINSTSTYERIIAKLPPLGPGVYNINFSVLAMDGHITEGHIRFVVLQK